MYAQQDLIRLFQDWFQGLGKFQNEPYHIKVNTCVPPKITPCMPVAVYQQIALKPPLAEMQAAGIIKPADISLHGSIVLS